MSPSLNLPIGSAVSINSTDLTEHNRKPISISNSIIDKSERMANGLMRTFFIANKRTINLSWEKIPSTSAMTVDGKAGAMDMRSLYYSLAGSAISLNIKRNNSQTEQIVCVFQSANFDLLNRNIRNVISQPTIIKITSATGSNGNIIYGYSGGSPVAGDKVDVRGFDSEQFNVNQALISSVSNGTFTVPSQKALQSSVTAAVSSNGTITYYSNNSFTPGDIVSISGLKTATITGATVGSNNVLFNCSNPPYAVGDVINITGVSPDVFNVSNSTVTEVLTNGFVATAPGIQSVAYVSGGTASSVFNLANVVVNSATNYYFTVINSATSIDLEDSTTGIATVFPENTTFNVTKIVPSATPTKKLTLTSANHDIVAGDVVSVSGVRTSATITNAAPRILDVINRSFVDSTGVATITTGEPHGYSTGDSITISNGIDATAQKFHGTHTITKTTDTSFTFVNQNLDSADITALSSSVTGTAKAKKTGEVKYTAVNTFVPGDRVTITGIDPSGYNGENLEVKLSSASEFVVLNNTTSRLRKGGTAINTFNVSETTVSSVTTNTIDIPHPYGVGTLLPATVTAAAGTGAVITYTANNNFSAGQIVSISGLSTTAFNLQNAVISSATPTQFVILSTATGDPVTGANGSATSNEMLFTTAKVSKTVTYAGEAIHISSSGSEEFWNVTLTFEEL